MQVPAPPPLGRRSAPQGGPAVHDNTTGAIMQGFKPKRCEALLPANQNNNNECTHVPPRPHVLFAHTSTIASRSSSSSRIALRASNDNEG